jgi:hypothetical protein
MPKHLLQEYIIRVRLKKQWLQNFGAEYRKNGDKRLENEGKEIKRTIK